MLLLNFHSVYIEHNFWHVSLLVVIVKHKNRVNEIGSYDRFNTPS